MHSTEKQDYRLATLYLCTIFQHLESLPDHLAVDALQMRLDWKYALHQSLKTIPMEATALCEFRKKLSTDPESKANMQKLLERVAEIPQIALCACVRQDACRVVQHVCTISRLANAWEAINNVLEALAIRSPEWLRAYSLPYWYERYGHSQKSLNMRVDMRELEDFAQAVGSDGFYLLNVIGSSGASELEELLEVITLRKLWNEQYEREKDKVIWKKDGCSWCSNLIPL
jgi:hypothetical protein